MACMHVIKCSTSCVIREMPIKTTTRYYDRTIRIAKIKLTTLNADTDVERRKHLFIIMLMGIKNGATTLEGS